jgi:hypothetical protein
MAVSLFINYSLYQTSAYIAANEVPVAGLQAGTNYGCYGIGANFTNDVGPNALNIVIKMTAASAQGEARGLC